MLNRNSNTRYCVAYKTKTPEEAEASSGVTFNGTMGVGQLDALGFY
jgi:hypothetical protein